LLDAPTQQKFSMVCGMILSSAYILEQSQKHILNFSPFEHQVSDPRLRLIIAGLLVGFGTQIGNGCTSGHGLCGLARTSTRSITAVMLFLVTAIVTATLEVGSYIPYIHEIDSLSLPANMPALYFIIAIFVMFIVVVFMSSSNGSPNHYFKSLFLLAIGGVFGFGLMVSGMTKRGNIFGFLELNDSWNPALFVVLMSGVGVNLIIFTVMRKVM
jgi:F0F1-type ATP synthase membrane subunit c/vacuolar-type H+-ATPase subunit K